MYTCAKCGQMGCAERNLEKTLPECPSKNEELQEAARAKYQEDENRFAFCKGLVNEAREVARILEYNGFEVVSAICKNGGIPKEFIGIEDANTLSGDSTREVMCNPIAQAMILNEAKTDFNVMLGLCVGHDTLFFKYIEGPVTVLAVKDRVTGRNPLAAVYCARGFYKKKFYPENLEENER